MSEIKNILLPNNEIFTNLKEYINAHSKVQTWVGRNKIVVQTPMIVFKEPRNEIESRSTTYDNTSRLLNYNINIYCKDRKDSYQVIQELIVLVSEVMEGYYHMRGGVVAIIEGYDEKDKNSYLANLRYTTRYLPKVKKLY